MTSYAQFARIVQQAMQHSSQTSGAITTHRDGVFVEMPSGEAFLLTAQYLPVEEVQRLFQREPS